MDVEGTTGNDEGEKETEKHEGNSDTVDTKGLTEGLPTSEYQELAENSSTMLDISEERNEKMLNTKESIEIRPVQGSSKQEAQGDVIEPVKEVSIDIRTLWISEFGLQFSSISCHRSFSWTDKRFGNRIHNTK